MISIFQQKIVFYIRLCFEHDAIEQLIDYNIVQT